MFVPRRNFLPGLLTAGMLTILAASGAHADNWPNWRGPNQNGVADGQGYATKWGTDQNVVWRVDMPAPSGSTPVVWEDRIFVTTGTGLDEDDQNAVICLDRNGQQIWTKTLGPQRLGKHKKGSGSNPSPVTDGDHLYCYYKSGDLACLDFEGNVVWHKNLQKEFGEDTLWWDLGTSPVLIDDAVVVACVQSGPSYVVAFDKATGDLRWKQDRMMNANEEANQTYSTPLVLGTGADQRLIVLGADHVTGHSATDGKELWRVGGLNPTNHKYFRSIASPVIIGNLVAAPYARGKTLTGIQLGGSGDVTGTHVKWTVDELSSDVPTPVAHDGKLYLLNDRGKVACVDPSRGETVWQGAAPKNRNAYSASPILADNRLYITREDGTTFVLATDSFQVLAENKLKDQIVATPVFVDGQILIRTAEHLYCIGQPSK